MENEGKGKTVHKTTFERSVWATPKYMYACTEYAYCHLNSTVKVTPPPRAPAKPSPTVLSTITQQCTPNVSRLPAKTYLSLFVDFSADQHPAKRANNHDDAQPPSKHLKPLPLRRRMASAHRHQDLYRLLGVSSSASTEEIKKAYRERAKQLHPDRNPRVTAAEEFKCIAEAYSVLVDSQRRGV